MSPDKSTLNIAHQPLTSIRIACNLGHGHVALFAFDFIFLQYLLKFSEHIIRL